MALTERITEQNSKYCIINNVSKGESTDFKIISQRLTSIMILMGQTLLDYCDDQNENKKDIIDQLEKQANKFAMYSKRTINILVNEKGSHEYYRRDSIQESIMDQLKEMTYVMYEKKHKPDKQVVKELTQCIEMMKLMRQLLNKFDEGIFTTLDNQDKLTKKDFISKLKTYEPVDAVLLTLLSQVRISIKHIIEDHF